MGGQSPSTVQTQASPVSQAFGQNPGYQQTPLNPAITAPQYPAALTPSVDDAAAATRARMMARTPAMAAPVTAPTRQQPMFYLHNGNAAPYTKKTP